MNSNPPRIIIAGTHSGVGKTTISLGIMAALKKRGFKVQPFKIGPDFLDPTYHHLVTGYHCHNLDSWLLDKDYLLNCFSYAVADKDIAIIEGVMGLYDGHGASSERGSTSEVAKWLNAPVLLVINASGMSRSAGAIALGFESYDKDLKLAGIIFNNVSSISHFQWLKEAVERSCNIPVIGGLTKNPDITIPHRHLGLITATPTIVTENFIQSLSQEVETGIDWERIISISKAGSPIYLSTVHSPQSTEEKCRIAVALDEAFHFYYQDNLDLLSHYGAELVFFSPLWDKSLPSNIHGIYIGGGYPEVFAKVLGENSSIKKQIRDFALGGGVVYAECGGFMYLTEGIETATGGQFPMVGIFPTGVKLLSSLKALGYVEIEAIGSNSLSAGNECFPGHEFHYSELTNNFCGSEVECTYKVKKKGEVWEEGYRIKNVLASYIHLHFGSKPELAKNFVDNCAKGYE